MTVIQDQNADRKQWMSLLAKCDPAELDGA
jgi:alpha-D-ribose 1-methylphosphonate 5-triphosphate synthase subunit PhnG